MKRFLVFGAAILVAGIGIGQTGKQGPPQGKDGKDKWQGRGGPGGPGGPNGQRGMRMGGLMANGDGSVNLVGSGGMMLKGKGTLTLTGVGKDKARIEGFKSTMSNGKLVLTGTGQVGLRADKFTAAFSGHVERFGAFGSGAVVLKGTGSYKYMGKDGKWSKTGVRVAFTRPKGSGGFSPGGKGGPGKTGAPNRGG